MILAFILIFSSQAMTARAEPLSWDECVRETANNNAELRAAKESLQASEYSVNGAYSGYFPQVSGSVSYSYGDSTNSSPSLELNGSSSASSTYGVSISASQNLFNGLQDKARVAQAEANAKISTASLEAVKARLSAELKNAYSSLLFAENAVKLQADILRRREENLRLVELRYESGRENKGSALLSKAYLNQARLDALQARNQIFSSSAQLSRVLGRDEAAELSVAQPVPTRDPEESPDFFSLAQGVPELKQALAQEESALASLTLARSGFFPILGLSATTGRFGRDWFPENNRWSIGVSLTIPLFSGGRDYFASKSASELLSAATLTRENTRRRLVTGLRQAFYGFTEAVVRLQVDQSFLAASQTRAEIARNKYNNGLISFDDWDIIENDLISRQRAVIQSQRDRITAEAAWEQAQGKGVLP